MSSIAAYYSSHPDWSSKPPRVPARDKKPVRKPDPLALLAHDMRGPLANLLLIIEGLASPGARDAEESKRTAKAMQLIERLDGLITSVIHSARQANETADVDAWSVSIPDLIEQTISLNEPFARHRGVRLHAYCTDPLTILGDGHLLMRALDNLITNAIKHSPSGGRVVVQATSENCDLIVRVEDDGPGFSKGDETNAFRPFTRLSERADKDIPSIGLGLSIVRQIAERHGGTAQIDPSCTRGGAVVMRLPHSRQD